MIHDRTTLILAAGTGARWTGASPKQLALCGGVPLIDRTIALARDFDISPVVVVTCDPRIVRPSAGWYMPRRCRWAVESLYETRPLWRERTVVLLGDVFYTEEAFAAITSDVRSLAFFGRSGPSRFTGSRHGEMFALVFDRSLTNRLITHLERAIEDARRGGRGKLWELYRSCAGLPLRRHQVEDALFCEIDDHTDDIDSVSEYRRKRRIWEGRVLRKAKSELHDRGSVMSVRRHLGIRRMRRAA
ncbi:MAG: hypothetical protein D6741_16455 [Planctomycetota bacterium]|nr:MAG: hypothetical protein D6741_16455 [Planctomycetota bacterium]